MSFPWTVLYLAFVEECNQPPSTAAIVVTSNILTASSAVGGCSCNNTGSTAQFFNSGSSNSPNSVPAASATCPNISLAGMVDVTGQCWQTFGTKVTGYDLYPFCDSAGCFVYAVPQCTGNGTLQGIQVGTGIALKLRCSQVRPLAPLGPRLSTTDSLGFYPRAALFSCGGCTPACAAFCNASNTASQQGSSSTMPAFTELESIATATASLETSTISVPSESSSQEESTASPENFSTGESTSTYSTTSISTTPIITIAITTPTTTTTTFASGGRGPANPASRAQQRRREQWLQELRKLWLREQWLRATARTAKELNGVITSSRYPRGSSCRDFNPPLTALCTFSP